MALKVEIDAGSGFCGGVIRAIGSAERFLDEIPGRHLFSLGAIVHNEEELARLGRKGLVTIDYDDLADMQDAGGESLLIRAHGEPPGTYARAAALGFNVIADPVVGYLYKTYLLGVPQEVSKIMATWAAGATAFNAVVGTIVVAVVYSALRPVLKKAGMFYRI